MVARPAESEVRRPVALVTGAGRGIGHAIAAALTDAGFRVAAVSLESAGSRPDMTPSDGCYYQADIADIDSHGELLDRIAADLGTPCCLVNNAGITSRVRGDLLALEAESFDATLAVNLRAAFFLSQAFANRLIGAKPAGPRSLIFIGSVNAAIVGENRADYCISKAGIAMMNQLFAARLAEHGIAVYEIRPGIIRTEMTAPATAKYDALIDSGGVPQQRWGEPGDVARTAAALATGTIPYATGIHIDVAGGLQMYRL